MGKILTKYTMCHFVLDDNHPFRMTTHRFAKTHVHFCDPLGRDVCTGEAVY